LSADVIPPGGEGEIKVTLTPKGNHPEISKRIVVESNDPEQPRFTLTMQGTLVFDVTANPSIVAMRDLPLNTPGTGIFALQLAEGTSAKIVSVSVMDPEKFEVRRLDGAAGGNGTYEIKYRGRDTVGSDATRVVVKTTGENTPELFVAVQASAALNLRYVDKVRFSYRQGVLQERGLRISARQGDAPKISKLEDPDGLLDIEVLEPQGPMASVRLTVREEKLQALTPEARAGMHKLIVHTNDKQEPRLEIEYSVAATSTAITPTPAPGTAPVEPQPMKAEVVR
jgi:hypothetical protein